MKKRTKKLVPLMPILVRLGACDAACRWVRDHNFATFAEAWDACESTEWLGWLICHSGALGYVGRDVKRRWFLARTAAEDRECFPAHIVERALYNYAVREGLA